MAKKFMYVCFGILALGIAFHLGARYGQADTVVTHSFTGVVAVETEGTTTGGEVYVLMDTGEMYGYDTPNGTEWYYAGSLPVPVTEIKFWSIAYFVTQGNEVWFSDYGNWTNLGAPPGGATVSQPTSWSQIKGEFGEAQ